MSAVDLGNGGKDVRSGTFNNDPSKKIKKIGAKGVVMPGKREREFPGIYEIDGDTLRWCINNRKTGLPEEFRTASGKYLWS